MRERLADLLTWLAAHPWRMGGEKSLIRLEALEPVHYLAVARPLARGRFMAMTGLPERTARRLLASLLDWGLLVSSNSRAPVVFPACGQKPRWIRSKPAGARPPAGVGR